MADSTLTLYESEAFGGNRMTDITQEILDVTQPPVSFATGVSSIKIGAKAGKWQVFTEKGYHGPHQTLFPGKEYPTLQSMSISSPVYSLRKE